MQSKVKVAILVTPVVILTILTTVFIWSIVHWDYPTVIGAMSPWLTLFGPTLAAGLVYIGWTRTHKDASERDRINQDRASDREFKNWQRSTIAQTVSPALEELELIRRDYDKADITTDELIERLKGLPPCIDA